VPPDKADGRLPVPLIPPVFMTKRATGFLPLYSGLTLNPYGVASPCPDSNLIHYKWWFSTPPLVTPT